MLTDNLKKFITTNVELIETNRFNELYKLTESQIYFSQGIGTLTRALFKAGIDPMPYLTEIPYCFLYGDYQIKKIDIPNNIEFIQMCAFCNCTDLTTVTLGKNVSVIYYGAFEGCVNLTNVTLNEGLLEIGQYAFRGTDIKKIRIPSTVRSIDIQAFPDDVVMEVFPGSYGHDWAFTNGYEVELVY